MWGFDERLAGRETPGGLVAGPIWVGFKQSAMGHRPVSDFPLPEGISFAHINPRTGLRASPVGGLVLLGMFPPWDTEPQAVTVVAEAPPPLEKSVSSETSTGGGSLSEAVAHSADDGLKGQAISNQPSAFSKDSEKRRTLSSPVSGVLLLVDCSAVQGSLILWGFPGAPLVTALTRGSRPRGRSTCGKGFVKVSPAISSNTSSTIS